MLLCLGSHSRFFWIISLVNSVKPHLCLFLLYRVGGFFLSSFICRHVLLTQNQKSTACFDGYKNKYFVYIFKIKAELFTTNNILLLFGSVNVFNSE